MIKNESSIITRRHFISTSILGVTAIYMGCTSSEKRQFLIRFDTESRQREEMKGFFEKIVSVQRSHHIPISFFCLGAAIDKRESEFLEFAQEVKDDPIFDFQNHSYSHIGLGYSKGKSVEVLKADYEKSFAVHERIFGRRPIGVSLCGTGGKDGPQLCGFDATEKSRAELNMLAKLGVKMINTFLCGKDSTKDFVNYSKIGHPEILGFPNGTPSDNSWLRGKKFGNPKEFITKKIHLGQQKKRFKFVTIYSRRDWICGFVLIPHMQCLTMKIR